jgi:hypothetical protein
MHRGWGNIDGVGEISPRFPKQRRYPKLTMQMAVITSAAALLKLNLLRHTEEGERGLLQVERYHARVLAYNPLSRAGAL